MLNPHDRRDLACLGLLVLVYGLAVAPVLHAVVGHGGGLGGTGHGHVHRARGHASAHGTHVHDGREHAHGSEHGVAGRAHAHAHAPGNAPGEENPWHTESGEDHARDEGPGTGHGPDGHQHLTGSVEHLHALAATWAVVKLPRVRCVSWAAELLRGPSRAPGAALRPTAMPQGP